MGIFWTIMILLTVIFGMATTLIVYIVRDQKRETQPVLSAGGDPERRTS